MRWCFVVVTSPLKQYNYHCFNLLPTTMEQYSITELKAAVYDKMLELERLQNEIRAINQEINNRPVKSWEVESTTQS